MRAIATKKKATTPESLSTVEVFDRVMIELKRLYRVPSNVKDYSRFYRDGKKHLSLSHPMMDKVSSEYFQLTRGFDKSEVFEVCNKLLKTKDVAARTIAFNWAFRMRRYFVATDIILFEKWLRTYVDSWDSCDDFCARALGLLIERFPANLLRLTKWTSSSNLWLRRASAVALIYSLRRGKYLKEAFKVASHLLEDHEDMVQKGYGWMLKSASQQYPEEVFAFVMKHRKKMPRTALRYAIEKMPPKMRLKAMDRS